MEKKNNREQPEIYALRQDGRNWQISRRDFLKAAGAGAAAFGAGLTGLPVNAENDIEAFCMATNSGSAHREKITYIGQSADRKYLVSVDSAETVKCWDLNTSARISMQKDLKIGDDTKFAAGFIRGVSCLVYYDPNQSTIYWREFPDLDVSSQQSIDIDITGTDKISGLTVDRDGNFYVSIEGSDYSVHRVILIGEGATLYSEQECIYRLDKKPVNDNSGMFLCNNDQKLFITTPNSENYYLDTVSGEAEHVNSLYLSPKAYAVLPDDRYILLCGRRPKGNEAEHNMFGLFSAEENRLIWEQNIDWGPSYEKLQGTTPKFYAAAVTPDSQYGILLGSQDRQPVFWLISMEDGNILKRYAPRFSSVSKILVSEDGSKFASAAGKQILFISIPGFEVLNCPVDLAESESSIEGKEIAVMDPVSGETVTYVMPCNAPIPDGVVCICNCVEGRYGTPSKSGGGSSGGCSCVGHKPGCSCVGYTAPHYWYPN